MHESLQQSTHRLRQRIVSAVSPNPSMFDGQNQTLARKNLGGPGGVGRLRPNHNREKVLGFAAAAVSLVLVSAPFLVNVDSDVVAKAATVTDAEQPMNTAEIITEMATGDDVIAALNTARKNAQVDGIVRDEQLHAGAQQWASTVADSGNLRNDRSLRALLDQRPGVGEFVIAARSLALAYQRLAENPAQHAQLIDPTTKGVGVGVSIVENKTYLVIRFAR
jgi:Cysteine-rich secretory protein family